MLRCRFGSLECLEHRELTRNEKHSRTRHIADLRQRAVAQTRSARQLAICNVQGVPFHGSQEGPELAIFGSWDTFSTRHMRAQRN